MKESEKRLIASMGSLLFIIGAVYVYSALIQPVFGEIQELRGKNKAKEAFLENYKTAIQQKSQVLSQYEGITGLQDVFSTTLPLEANIPLFLNQIYGLAKLNNVSVQSVDFQKEAIQPTAGKGIVEPYRTISATIRAESDYEDMKSYLKAIETNVRLMRVISINIGEGFRKNPRLSYTITVETYYIEK